MSLSFNPILLLCSALITSGCSLALALQMRRLKKTLASSRAELTKRATVESNESKEKKATADFSDSLMQASLKQRLQNAPDWRQPPEKYRYAAALAEQGMDAEGIAAVLHFPLEEAEQLIALKRAALAQLDLESSDSNA